MKAPPFEFHAPDTVEEVLALLAEHGDEAKVLAGGQSLVPLLSFRLARPSVLVDVNRVAGLDGITLDGDDLVLGATVRERAAERAPLVGRHAPLLAAALPFIGHEAIRNRGTVGGSIAHADPAAELPAVAVALDATITAASKSGGTRAVAAGSFFQGYFTTSLAAEELLREVRFPPLPAGTGVAVEEVARRHGDFALVGVAAAVTVADGVISDARIALFNVAEAPVRASASEAALAGQAPTAEVFAAAAAAAAAGLEPPSDLHASATYRKAVATTLVRRALTRAASGDAP